MGGQGSQFWVHASLFPKKPETAASIVSYKNSKDIPEKYYRLLGLEKAVE
jgi:hypothetical protein